MNLFCGIDGEGEGSEAVVVDALWKEPEEAGEIMRELRAKNEDLYMFEKMLEAQ